MTEQSPMKRLGRLGRLIRKEVSTILRDRRTIITLVLMPLLLYPLLTIAFRQFLLVSKVENKETPHYRLGFASDPDGQFVREFAKFGESVLKKESERATVQSTEPMPQLGYYPFADPRDAVRKREIELALFIRRPTGNPSPSDRNRELALDLDVYYLEDSFIGREALHHLERVLDAAHRKLLDLRRKPVPEGTGSAVVLLRPLISSIKDTDAKTGLSLSALIPLVLILMTITGAVYPAIDLTAGERERGTLEILVAAPIPRLELLFAKYVSVLTVAVLTALVNLGTMTMTLAVTGLGQKLFGGGLSFLLIAQVFFLLLLFAAFFSAVLLTVTSFARSFKEAQAYLIPLVLVSMTPGMVSLLPGMDLTGAKVVTPLLNIVLLTRDLLEGKAVFATASIVVASTIVYALAAIALAARIFGAEAVLYSEQAGWGDLFRRPATPQPTAKLSSVLFCLAIMFPVLFVFQSLPALLLDLGPEVLLLVNAAGFVVLFGLIPYVFAWVGRVRLVSALCIERLGIVVWGAMLLFGVALWPFADLVRVGLEKTGLSLLNTDMLAGFADVVNRWQGVPLPMLLLCLAVIPAVLEEAFFRGFLFSALQRASTARTAIIASALFFGLFHLVGPLISTERGVISTLLGFLLGWVAWRTGSVVPGMILHTVYNSCLQLLGYYKDSLLAAGWFDPTHSMLPPRYVLAGLAACVVAAVWVHFTTRRLPLGEPSDVSRRVE